MRAALAETDAPVVAVSPLVGGRSLKGPTEAFMAWAGHPVDDGGIAAYYAGLAGMVVDRGTPTGPATMRASCCADRHLMPDGQARARLATRRSSSPCHSADRFRSMPTAAILPVKSFVNAKQRLGGTFGDPERAALAAAMVEDVLDELAARSWGRSSWCPGSRERWPRRGCRRVDGGRRPRGRSVRGRARWAWRERVRWDASVRCWCPVTAR